MPRTVTLVLLDADGDVLGALPPYEVALPWWQEVADVVAGAQELYGIPVSILRLLATENAAPHGGAVTYLAQTSVSPSGLVPVAPELSRLAISDEPLRTAYARPGGPAASLAWAEAALGRPVVAQQQRTWNLSAIWRLNDGPETVWLKQVPTFFAHEAAVLAWAGSVLPYAVPRLLAHGDEGRLLLEHIEGEDLYDATGPVRAAIAAVEHELQLRSVGAVDDLVAAGVPDLRGGRLAEWIRSLLTEPAAGHPAEALLDTLDASLDEVAACGLPDALVHGDAHPGNAIASGDRTVLIDWGDSFVGHPGFDALRIGVGLEADAEAVLVEGWARSWQASVPGATRCGRQSCCGRWRACGWPPSTPTSWRTSSRRSGCSTPTTYVWVSTGPSRWLATGPSPPRPRRRPSRAGQRPRAW